MTIAPTNLLIIAFVCVTIGYVAGILITNLRGSKTEPSDQPEVPETAAPSDGLIEVARLVREDPRGPLQIKVNEKHYHLASEMNRRERDSMEEATVELLNWLGYSPNANQSQPRPEAAQPAEDAAPLAPAAPAPEIAQVQPELAPVQAAGPAAPIAPAPVVIAVPVKEAPKTIVGQINDILQEKLEGTTFALRRVRLVESINGVSVQVGLNTYPDINAVPEEEIRSLIRASAAEWEKRAGR